VQLMHHSEAADQPSIPKSRWRFGYLVWFIVKNILGWVLILGAGPVGVLVPGPGGLPLFLIGFALITFPRKRHLTARVLRGMPVRRDSKAYGWLVFTVALLVPAAAISWWRNRWFPLFDRDVYPDHLRHAPGSVVLLLLYLCSATLIWIFGLRGIHIINLGLRLVSRVRRRVRPWLRRKGIDLLPPRRRLRHGKRREAADEGILEIDQRYEVRAKSAWKSAKPILRKALGIAITAGIFFYMFRPVYLKWNDVKGPLAKLNWGYFLLGSAMFAVFLLVIRVVSWRRILAGLGFKLPLAPAARIWSTSELARYLPGAVWQVAGRVYLIKPYGVSGSICSTSQVLELAVFLLANICVALACMLKLGAKNDPQLAKYLYGVMAITPILLFLLHPRVFYGLFDRIMKRLGKPPITQRLQKRELLGLGAYAVLGLIWQGFAIWLVVHGPLGLKIDHWWIVTGTYCFAWCCGFLAFWAPGGLGVREFVFVMAMEVALPKAVREQIHDPIVRKAILAFIGILLRLWATVGELMLSAIAHLWDYKGAVGRPDAPGRVCQELPEIAGERVTG
jgi:hypothetical protein